MHRVDPSVPDIAVEDPAERSARTSFGAIGSQSLIHAHQKTDGPDSGLLIRI